MGRAGGTAKGATAPPPSSSSLLPWSLSSLTTTETGTHVREVVATVVTWAATRCASPRAGSKGPRKGGVNVTLTSADQPDLVDGHLDQR